MLLLLATVMTAGSAAERLAKMLFEALEERGLGEEPKFDDALATEEDFREMRGDAFEEMDWSDEEVLDEEEAFDEDSMERPARTSDLQWTHRSNTEPRGILWYKGSGYGCKTAHGQCYWSSVAAAKAGCASWNQCKALYCSRKHNGGPFVCYARTGGPITSSSGDSSYTKAGASWSDALLALAKSTGLKSLVNKGGSGCTSSRKCGMCEGDCDSDNDCGTGLKCHQRSGYAQVPGCRKGGSGDVRNYDFCYNPKNINNKGNSGCTGSRKCMACEGDCDRDSDCFNGLKCKQRSQRNVEITGCKNGGPGHYDFCYQPTSGGKLALVNKGGSGCTNGNKCQECEGDCDRDSDCMPGLKCFQRSGYTQVPGCLKGGRGDQRDYDFCVKK